MDIYYIEKKGEIIASDSFFKINNLESKKIKINDEDFGKIMDERYKMLLINGEIIFEKNTFFEKEDLIGEYKKQMEIIKDLSFEINEVEETKHFLPEDQQVIATNRVAVLKQRRTVARDKLAAITNEGVEKYGEDIINQF